MNHHELQEDIKKLRSLRQEAKDKYDKAMESGRGKISLDAFFKQATETSDQILEKYLGDFETNFPSLLSWKSEKSKIGGRNVHNITSLSDSELITVTGSKLLFFAQTRNNKWEPNGEIKVSDRYFLVNALRLSDQDFVALEMDKMVGLTDYVIYNKSQNVWQRSGEFTNKHGDVFHVTSLSDHSFMAEINDERSSRRVCQFFTKTQDNRWELDGEIEAPSQNFLMSTLRISDHEFITDEEDGSVDNCMTKRVFNKTPDGWQPGEIIKIFNGLGIIRVSDSQLASLIHDTESEHSMVRFFDKKDGNWQPGEKIEIPNQDEHGNINRIVRLSDDQLASFRMGCNTITIINKTLYGWRPGEEITISDKNSMIYRIVRISDNQFAAIVENEDHFRTITIFTRESPTTQSLKWAIQNNQWAP